MNSTSRFDPSTHISVRVAEQDDVRALTTAVNGSGGLSFYKAVFGAFHLPTMIDCSCLALVAETVSATDNWAQNDDGNKAPSRSSLQGFLVINDQMSVLVDDYSFDSIVGLMKEYIPVTVNNSLLFNFWMASEQVGNPAAFELIKEAFNVCVNTDFFIWICPFSFILPDAFEKLFTSILVDNTRGPQYSKLRGYRLLFCHRSNFLPRLSVRTARVEDNDDLIPIIQKTNPDVLLGQDRYFLADLINAQDAQNRFYVGLDKRSSRIVGMLSTSVDVNMSLIMKMFSIDSFPELVIQSDSAPPPPPLLVAVLGDLRLIDFDALEEMLAEQNVLLLNFERETSMSLAHQNISEFVAAQVRQRSNGNEIQAVIMFGFPRTEAEATAYCTDIVASVDLICELVNISEDMDDEEEEDDFLQKHLDAVDLLRDKVETEQRRAHEQRHANEDLPKLVSWQKINFDVDSYHTNQRANVKKLVGTLASSLDQRTQLLEAAREREREKPPSANAFAVTSLCIEEEFCSRSIDLLKLAFEDQQQDYCLYMVNNERERLSLSQSRETHCFTFVPLRKGISFDHSLFIIHRAFFFAQEHLSLHRLIGASTKDGSSPQRIREQAIDQEAVHLQVLALFKNVDEDLEHARALLDSSLQDSDLSLAENPINVTLCARVGDRVVAAISLSRARLSATDALFLRERYHLDDILEPSRHKQRGMYIIEKLAVDTAFSAWTRFILRAAMRLCSKTAFLFLTEHKVVQEMEDWQAAPPKEILEEFTFVRPKKQRDDSHLNILSSTEEPNARKTQSSLRADCALFCVSKGKLAFKKNIVGTRVVIVGGSSQSMALLSTLCALPSLYFPNLYFVSELPPLPMVVPTNAATAAESAMKHVNPGMSSADAASERTKGRWIRTQFGGCLSPKDVDFPMENELYAEGFAFRVRSIPGKLTDIDREHKAIVVSDEVVLEYDILVLSTPTQDNTSHQISTLKGVHPAKCADAGIFLLGNDAADMIAMNFCLKRAANRADPILIAGSSIRAFAATQSLLRCGIDPSKICIVINEPSDSMNLCYDATVSNLVVQSAELAKIQNVEWNSVISELSLSRNGFLQSVEIRSLHSNTNNSSEESKSAPLHIACSALLLCSDNQVCEKDVFSAINDCGLVFDGGLVVDLTFKTVDSAIYGVSEFSKFSRMYRDELLHNRYNAREIGAFVGLQIIHRHLLLPHPPVNQRQYRPMAVLPESKHDTVIVKPKFSLPKSVVAELPGGVCFFFSQLPRMPKESFNMSTDSATSSSFGPAGPRHVTSIKLDNMGTICEIVYAGMQLPESRALSSLVGQHESFLNSCLYAHGKGLVDDWIEFFRGGWAAAIFHDDFAMFVKSLKQSIINDKGMLMTLSRVFEKAEATLDDAEVDSYRRELIGVHGEVGPDGTRRIIELQTEEYLRERRAFLPHYFSDDKKAAAST